MKLSLPQVGILLNFLPVVCLINLCFVVKHNSLFPAQRRGSKEVELIWNVAAALKARTNQILKWVCRLVCLEKGEQMAGVRRRACESWNSPVHFLFQCMGTESGQRFTCRPLLSPSCTCFVLQFWVLCAHLSVAGFDEIFLLQPLVGLSFRPPCKSKCSYLLFFPTLKSKVYQLEQRSDIQAL